MDRQQARAAVVDDQAIRHRHFGAHRITAEDHPWIENGKLAEGPVKLARLNGQILSPLRVRQFEPGPDLLPKMIRRNHAASNRRKPFREGIG
jgi:hypothetical protein